MSRTLFLVGAGGFLGSILRYLTAVYLNKVLQPPFPYGTMAVNIVGCFVIGIVFGLSERFAWFSSDWRIFLATGLCGGYTTFSTFSIENVKFLQAGDYLTFSIYSILSFTLGLLSTFVGLLLTKI